MLVVNTCAFIDRAKQESIDTILEMAELKKQAPGRRLVVTGCLAERYREELQKEIPEIDAVLGTGEVPRILEALTAAADRRPSTAAARQSGDPPLTFHRQPPRFGIDLPDYHLRRRHAAPARDARPLRLSEDCRRLRLQVRVLHHSEDARALSQPHRGVDRHAKRARSRRAASRSCC